MKKFLLVMAIFAIFLSAKSAPFWSQYDILLSSQTYLEQVELTAKIYAKDVLINLPNPSTAEEIRRYNWCQDVLGAKPNSVVIYRIASFVTNDTYINNFAPVDIYNDLLNAYQQNPSGYTIFDIIGKVNLP